MAAPSAIAYWKKIVAPDSPDGQLAHGSVRPPAPLVARGSVARNGLAHSVPPLKGTGVLLSEMNSRQAAEGAALVRASEPAEPVVSGPVPTSAGSPLTPASARPRSVHGLG